MATTKQVLVGDPQTAAGQRDRLVRIEQAVQTTGPSGFPIETWTTLRSAWMGRRDDLARERATANQLSAAVETFWYTDWAEDMDPEGIAVTKTRRLVYRGRTFDILAATVLERRAIELVTIAKVD